MKLKRFNKKTKVKLLSIVSTVLVLGTVIGITLYKSFATFSVNKTFNVIQGKIPNKNSGDVTIAILVGNDKRDTFPDKNSYKYIETKCTNEDANVTFDKDSWKLSISNIDKKTNCIIKFETIYNSITVDKVEGKEFPSRGDYYINMNCSNVDSASFDENTWAPIITGVSDNSSCSPIFKSKSSVITNITLDDKKLDEYPEKGAYGNPKVECTDGAIGSWDSDKYKPVVTNVTNNTTCEVKFKTIDYGDGSLNTVEDGYNNKVEIVNLDTGEKLSIPKFHQNAGKKGNYTLDGPIITSAVNYNNPQFDIHRGKLDVPLLIFVYHWYASCGPGTEPGDLKIGINDEYLTLKSAVDKKLIKPIVLIKSYNFLGNQFSPIILYDGGRYMQGCDAYEIGFTVEPGATSVSFRVDTVGTDAPEISVAKYENHALIMKK